MFTPEFNVYETLAKLDSLLEDGHEEPSPMDRAEYQVLMNRLVQGSLELLRHLSMHEVIVLETNDSFHSVAHDQISVVETENDGGFSDEVVAIELPSDLVDSTSIVEALNDWDLGSVETTADLTSIARAFDKVLHSDQGSALQDAAYAEWTRQATRLAPKVHRSVALLEASGMLQVLDLRTNDAYPAVPALADGDSVIYLSIETAAAVPVRASKPAPKRKKVSA